MRTCQRVLIVVFFCACPFQDKDVENCNFIGIALQDATAVRQLPDEIGTRPVQDGHEVVADDFDSSLGEVAKTLLVNFNVVLPVAGTGFDIPMDGDAFRYNPFHTGCFNHFNAFGNSLFRPQVTAADFVESVDDAGNAGLPDVA